MPRKTVVTKKSKPKKAATDDARIVDIVWLLFARYSLHAGKHMTKEGLRKRRDELEAIVEPHLTTQKTRLPALFKGSGHYVGTFSPESTRQEVRLVAESLRALECIYNFEAAKESGDIDAALAWTYKFALVDFDVSVIQKCGVDAWVAVENWKLATAKGQNSHQLHVDAGAGKRKFKTDEQRRHLVEAFAKNRGRNDWLKATRDDTLPLCGFKTLSKKAVRTELKALYLVT
jgi:hypothetical protein